MRFFGALKGTSWSATPLTVLVLLPLAWLAWHLSECFFGAPAPLVRVPGTAAAAAFCFPFVGTLWLGLWSAVRGWFFSLETAGAPLTQVVFDEELAVCVAGRVGIVAPSGLPESLEAGGLTGRGGIGTSFTIREELASVSREGNSGAAGGVISQS